MRVLADRLTVRVYGVIVVVTVWKHWRQQFVGQFQLDYEWDASSSLPFSNSRIKLLLGHALLFACPVVGGVYIQTHHPVGRMQFSLAPRNSGAIWASVYPARPQPTRVTLNVSSGCVLAKMMN